MKLHIRKLEEIKTTGVPGHPVFGKDFGMAIAGSDKLGFLVPHVSGR